MFKKFIFIFVVISSVSSCMFLEPDGLKVISATDLNQLMQKQDIFLVDVHTPKMAHIKGTDLFMPFSEVKKYQAQLPKDKDTAIYLYCEGGPMGNAAARSLNELGYHNLYNLEGGSHAWKKSGFEFE